MPVGGQGSTEAYRALLSQIANPVATVAPDTQALIRRFVSDLEALPVVDQQSLAALISGEPEYVPVLASVVGLTQERLKRQLQYLLGSAAWATRARTDPLSLIDALDKQFGLVERAREAREITYTLSDVLIARAGTRAGAGDAIDAGRYLEDLVERVIERLGLPFRPRSRFIGRGGETASADFAIPGDGADTLIAVAAKGFDSTGSKLSDAVGEIRRMADIRKPTQYVFAVVDGLGWHGRAGDLSRLVEMVRTHRIDGMFALKEFAELEEALRSAAVRVGLLAP